MKETLKKFIAFIFRIDIFNRIIVFISMILFLILPSYVLYMVDDYNTYLTTILPCIMLLSCLIGTGLFTLYKPTKLSIFYFLELLVILCMYRENFIYVSVVGIGMNLSAISTTEIVYASLGLFLNTIFMLKYYMKRPNKYSFKDITNGDSLYDFLNARPINKKIEKDIEALVESSSQPSLMPIVKKIKLSRFVRNLSYLVFLTCVFFYMFNILARSGDSDLWSVLVISLLVSLFLIAFTIIYPKDYKYLFYYTTIIFEISGLICCRRAGLSPVFFIIAISINVISLLVTLITEGRIWTGAEPDD